MATAHTSKDAPPVPDGEFAFTWEDFRMIAAFVHGEAGIVLPESKVNLVYSRLAKRLRAIGLRSFREYCLLVQSSDGVDERQQLIAAMTTNVTRLFREQHHFDHLISMALPPLVQAARRGQKVRIWSSACSSGEEPYSIALALLHVMPDAAEHDVLILASDIDPDMLARGREACYPQTRLADIPDKLRGRYTEADPADPKNYFRFTEQVQKLIRFRQLNLLKEWPLRAKFDVIFCRNVMIYFDQETQDAIWTRFAQNMSPGGYLYIGHSERIDTDVQPFTLAAQTTYRLAGGKK